MKKLFLLITLIAISFMGFAQNCPIYYDGAWVSSTHPYDLSSQYRFITTIPNNTGDSYIGKWMNDYRIKIQNPADTTKYTWYCGNNQFGYQAEFHLYNSSNAQPSSNIVMGPGYSFQVSTDGLQPIPNSPTTGISGMTYECYQTASNTIRILPNPYFDRSLRYAIKLNKYYSYTSAPIVNGVMRLPDCSLPVQYPPLGVNYVGVFVMKYPWVEIEQPAKKGGAFVNAGNGLIMAAGAPGGSGPVGNVEYPTNIQAGNLLLLVTTTRISGIQSTAPAGWSNFASFSNTRIYSKVATGTETGTVAVTYSGSTTNGRHLRIFQFYNVGATPHSLATGISGTMSPVTCVNKDELVVSFIFHGTSTAIGTYTGTNFSFTEPVAETIGGNSSLGINIGRFPTAGSNTGTGLTGNGGNIATFILK